MADEETPRKRSMRAAINAMCRDCIYDDAAGGTWRQQTDDCTIKSCPLWSYRPRTKAPVAQ